MGWLAQLGVLVAAAITVYFVVLDPQRRAAVAAGWRVLVPVLMLAMVAAGCVGGGWRWGRPAEPHVEAFMAAVVDGDLDRARELATGDLTGPTSEPRAGSGVAMSRGHFDATFSGVVHAERRQAFVWELTRTDGNVHSVAVVERADGVQVLHTSWSVTAVGTEEAPAGLWVDGHPAVVTWQPWTHGQWYAGIYTHDGPKVFEVEFANGTRLTAHAVREEEGQRPTCCVHFNGRTGEVTVHRSGPHRPEGM